MKIALLGYGKMGKTIEQLALADGHAVALRIDLDNLDDLTTANLQQADVAIEFSRPESAFRNVMQALEAGVPVVCGTTGWLDRLEEARQFCREREGAFLYASNFSIGVNLFFALNRYLARLMAPQGQYDVRMEEIHHTQKLDAPSGTAITLAEDIIRELPRKKIWSGDAVTASDDVLLIASKRIGQTPGTHEVTYASPIDTISIRHEAHSREGFARGALLAAGWLIGRKGCFGMNEVLGI